MIPTINYGEFTTLLKNGGIVDPDYPSKGGYVWLPDGFDFKENVFSSIESKIKEKGYRRYQFPRLIPGSAIKKVTASIDNFEKGIFWLSDNSGNPHNLFLNPTGECGVYTMFQKWIRQETDLPIRVYQIGTTFRPHHRSDVMLNGDELSNLLEAHSAFVSKSDADNEFSGMTDSLHDIHKRMGLPFLALRRPLVGNKPVCTDMVSFETYLPSKRTSFNVGVHYNQGQIYSKAFKVAFNSDKGKENTHQVTFGISERGIAAMLDLHRDEYGLRLLPDFAPVQALIMPVIGNDSELSKVLNYVDCLKKDLGDYRFEVDMSNGSIGKRLAKARLRGIPLRITVDSQDVQNGTLRAYLRTQEDYLDGIVKEDLIQSVPSYLAAITNKITSDASDFFQSRIQSADSIAECKDVVNENLLARIYYCGSENCLITLHDNLPGELIGSELSPNVGGKCLLCDSSTNNVSYYARRGSSP